MKDVIRGYLAGLFAFALLILPTTRAEAHDAGVIGKKLVIIDKSPTGGQSTVSLIIGKSPEVHKGADGDPALLDGELKLYYDGGPTGNFPMPSPWKLNKKGTAVFVNKAAPIVTPVNSARIKTAKSGKISAKALGGLNLSSPPGANGVIAEITIRNGIDNETHRMCTKFAANVGSSISVTSIGGSGNRKLLAKNGAPTACPSTPPLCGSSAQTHTFTVNSNSGGAFDSAEWPGGTQKHTFSPGCTVTIQRPNANIDLVCDLANPFAVVGTEGFSACFGTDGEDGDGCAVSSCPFAGVGSCCSTRPSCSVGTNGSGTATYKVQCNP